MDLIKKLNEHLPVICKWAKTQEDRILSYGSPLDEDQQIDAYLIGVKNIDQVRLLIVKEVPTFHHSELERIIAKLGLLSSKTIGITFRYGIYIREDYWNKRSLVVHELTHTMQYERLGSFSNFLRQYITECIQVGYPFGDLEQEAKYFEKRLCK